MLYNLLVSVLYSGVACYIVYTVNARVLDWFKSRVPLADTQLSDVQTKLEELQTKVNAISIHYSIKED